MNNLSCSTRSCQKPASLLKATRGLLPMVAILALAGGSKSAKADVITYFNFNDANPTQANLFASDGGARASTITTTFPNQGSPGGIGTVAGTTDNAQFGSAAGNALQFPTGNGTTTSNNGNSFSFGVNTQSYSGISVSFSGMSQAGSFNPYQFRYSTDGGATYTTLGSTLGPTFTTQNYDLTAIAGLNNNSNALFQVVFNGATNPGAFTAVDNIVVSGTAAPEPETWAMMGLGVIALGIFQMRRKRSSQFSPIPQGFAI